MKINVHVNENQLFSVQFCIFEWSIYMNLNLKVEDLWNRSLNEI
jgi:hypothetical protein